MALNARQRKYCRERANGASYAEAYRKAGFGPNASNQSRKHNAYNMENMDGALSEKIQAEIKRLQDLADKKAILTREQRQAILTEWALNSDNDMPDRLRSMDQLNRMSGDYTDTVRTQVTGQVKMSLAEKLEAWDAAMNNETT